MTGRLKFYPHGESLVHEIGQGKKSYCSPACLKKGSYATMARAEEAKKKFNRIKYGRTYEKKSEAGRVS